MKKLASKNISILIFVAILACFVTASAKMAYSSPEKPLKKLIIPSYVWPPFNILKESGEWSGADVEITRDILKKMGYEAVFKNIPFKRILKEMKSGKHLCMVPCVEGGGREEYMLFSDPVSTIFSVLWKRQKNKICWSTYDDLKGKTISASPYHYGAGFFDAAEAGKFNLQIVPHESPELLHFRKLKAKRVDMFICELSVGLYIKQHFSPEFDNIDFCEKGIGPTRPFSLAVSRKYFKGREKEMNAFIDLFNHELQLYSLQGKRKRVFEKYNMLIELDNNGKVVFQKDYIDTP